MFDIGFWELIVIGVVALIVVGPERFPSMVKKTGQYVGQFRRIAASVKSEIQTEVDKAEQLQDLLEEQKKILKRNADVDLTQPAVKIKSPETEKKSSGDSGKSLSNEKSVKAEKPADHQSENQSS